MIEREMIFLPDDFGTLQCGHVRCNFVNWFDNSRRNHGVMFCYSGRWCQKRGARFFPDPAAWFLNSPLAAVIFPFSEKMANIVASFGAVYLNSWPENHH